MGACLSTKKKAHSGGNKKQKQQGSGAGLAPPSPPEDEAVVKEVLSETPKLPAASTTAPPAPPPERSLSKRGGEELKIEKAEVVDGCRGGDDARSEEASEICSVSESYSVSTTVTGEEEVSTRWRGERSTAGKYYQRKRSASGDFTVRRDYGRGGGVGGRSSPSPARRGDVRSFPGREAGQGTRAHVQGGSTNASVRRDQGERSGRRSASPATKRAPDQRLGCGGGGGVSRSSSFRKAGRASPRRIPSAGEETRRRRAAEGEEEEEATEGVSGPLAPPGKESLENPLVSLECFIFL